MKHTQTIKFVPVEKLSKKARAEISKSQRGSWNGVNPVTRIVKTSKKTKLEKAYRREAACY